MLDKSKIGQSLPEVKITLEVGQLRLFAKATGQTEAIFLDEKSAQAAGFRSIVAPPTFVTCLYSLGRADPLETYRMLGVPVERILHGEEQLELHQAICAGDALLFQPRVVDIYSKKNGALEFIVQETLARNQFGQHVATFRRTILVRN